MDETREALRAEKDGLLDTIESRVNNYIVGTQRHCIDLVERNAEGEVVLTWDLKDLDDFARVLIRFLRKKQSKSGRVIDSALTDPILEIVKAEYREFFERRKDKIASGILQEFAAEDVQLKSFIDRLSQIALNKLNDAAREKIVELLSDQIKDSISQGALLNVGEQVADLAATAAGTQIGAIVATLLIHLLATHIGVIVSKVLASAALQQLIIALGQKLFIGVISAAVFNFLTVQFGAAVASSSVLWVVIPIVTSYLVYKITTFPEDLGEEVSKEVRAELEKVFDSTTKSVMDAVYESVFSGDELAEAISQEREFQDAINKLAEQIVPTS